MLCFHKGLRLSASAPPAKVSRKAALPRSESLVSSPIWQRRIMNFKFTSLKAVLSIVRKRILRQPMGSKDSRIQRNRNREFIGAVSWEMDNKVRSLKYRDISLVVPRCVA